MSLSAETAGFDADASEDEESAAVEGSGWDVGDTPAVNFVCVAAAALTVPNPEGPAPTVSDPEAPGPVVPDPEGPASTVPDPEGPAPTVPDPEGPAEVDAWGWLMGGWLKEQHYARRLGIKLSKQVLKMETQRL